MRTFPRHSPPFQNQGVVLIVVMIMLVLIGFMSAAVMRGAINSDQVSNNNRAQMQATEAAQLALRFCEVELTKSSASSPLLTIAAAPPDSNPKMLWESKGSWTGGTPLAIKVPEDAMKTTGMATSLRQPECLAQYAFNTDPSPVVLTVRGFSGDYTENRNTNQIESGSVIWLQSTFLLQPVTPPSP